MSILFRMIFFRRIGLQETPPEIDPRNHPYSPGYTSPSRQWLRDSLAKQVEQSLQTFLSDYYQLALWAYRSGVLVYRFVPKLHAWKHIHLRLQGELALARGYTFNPAIYATANDEDFVGKASRPIRDLHSGNASLRRLELYRIELQREWG